MGGLPLGGVRRGEGDRRAARGVAPRGRQVDCHLPWISEIWGIFLGAAAIHLHFASALIVVVTKKLAGSQVFFAILSASPRLYNCCHPCLIFVVTEVV